MMQCLLSSKEVFNYICSIMAQTLERVQIYTYLQTGYGRTVHFCKLDIPYSIDSSGAIGPPGERRKFQSSSECKRLDRLGCTPFLNFMPFE